MNQIFALETTKYKIKIENFEGPLDLLCHLIDVNKMDIYDVNINEITDQYIEYINKMQELDMEVTSEFLEMVKEGSERMYSKLPEQIKWPKQSLEINYTKDDLKKYYLDVINKNSVRLNKNAKNIEKIAIVETYSVGDTVRTMFKELIKKSHFVFNKLYSINNCKPQEVITAFSGLLEMSRRDKVVTDQKEIFGDIEVTKKKKN